MIYILWLLIVVVLLFCFVAFFGAPYVPTFSKDLHQIFSTIKLKKQAKVIDLGSGDGRMLLIAAKKGYHAIGYELNPILWAVSKWRLRKYPNAKVRLGNFWSADVKDADLVFCFLATKYMPRLEKKLSKEMKQGSYFVSYAFELPNTKVIKKTTNTHYYKF